MKYVVRCPITGDHQEYKSKAKAITVARTMPGATVTAEERSGTWRSTRQVYPTEGECYGRFE